MILGASFDTPDENLAFAQAQDFPYQMLSDVDHRVGALYEVVREPGEQYAHFAKRHSYLIDPDGIIRKAYDVADVARHAADVVADIERLQGGTTT